MATGPIFCYRCLEALPEGEATPPSGAQALVCGHSGCYHPDCLTLLHRSQQNCPCKESATPACAALAHVLSATKGDKMFQSRGLHILTSLIAQNNDAQLQELYDLGMATLVCEDLGNFPGELDLVRWGLYSLHAFTVLQPSLIKVLVETNFCPKICWSMARAQENEELQLAGCRLIGLVAQAEPQTSVHLFELSEGPRLVCEAAKRFMQSSAMQRAALDAIRGMAWGLGPNGGPLLDNKASRLLLEIIARNGSDRKMVLMGLRTISALATGVGADAVGTDGGCALLVKLLAKYGDDKEMLVGIMETLGNITANSTANRQRLGTDAGVGAVMKVLNANVGDQKMQLQGCRLVTYVTQEKGSVEAKERFGAAGACVLLLKLLEGVSGQALVSQAEVLLWCTRAMMALIAFCPANQARFVEGGAVKVLTDAARELSGASRGMELSEAMAVVLGGLGIDVGAAQEEEAEAAGGQEGGTMEIEEKEKPKPAPLQKGMSVGPGGKRNSQAMPSKPPLVRRESEAILARARAELARMQGGEGEEGQGEVQTPSAAGRLGGRQPSMMLKRQGSISPYVGQPQEGEEEGKPRGRLARQPSLMIHQGAEPQGEVRASMQETDRENGDAFDATPAPGGVGLKRTGSMMLVQGGPGMRRAGSRSLIVVDNNMRTTQGVNAINAAAALASTQQQASGPAVPPLLARQNTVKQGPDAAPMTARGGNPATTHRQSVAPVPNLANLQQGGGDTSGAPQTARGQQAAMQAAQATARRTSNLLAGPSAQQRAGGRPGMSPGGNTARMSISMNPNGGGQQGAPPVSNTARMSISMNPGGQERQSRMSMQLGGGGGQAPSNTSRMSISLNTGAARQQPQEGGQTTARIPMASPQAAGP